MGGCPAWRGSSCRPQRHTNNGMCICDERCDARVELFHQQGDFREEWCPNGSPCREVEPVRARPFAASKRSTQEGNPIGFGLCEQDTARFMKSTVQARGAECSASLAIGGTSPPGRDWHAKPPVRTEGL